MRGRRPGKTGGVFAGIHRGFFRAENDADGRGSFAAVEQSMSDRLLGVRTMVQPHGPLIWPHCSNLASYSKPTETHCRQCMHPVTKKR